MIAVSTVWNAARHGGYASAVRELTGLGHRAVALDGDALHGDAAAAARDAQAAKGRIVVLFAPRPRAAARRVAGELAPALCAPREETRDVAVRAALAAADAAVRAGTPRVVLRAGRLPEIEGGDRETVWVDRMHTEGASDALRADVRRTLVAERSDRERALDGLCRSLHALSRARPEVHWLLETPDSPTGLPLPAETEHVLDDLRGRRLGYWHDAAHAARLGVLGAASPDEWLGRLAAATAGVTLADWSPIADRMPPGSGHVQWRALRFQMREGMFRVLALDPEYPAALLDDTLREVRNLGF